MKKVSKWGDNEIKVLKILKDNPEGLRIKTIHKLSNIGERTLYRAVNKLKKKRLISNISPMWKLVEYPPFLSELLKSDKLINLHDLSFTLRLIKTPSWWDKRENKLMRIKDFHYKKNIKWGTYPYTQTKKNDFLIQFHKNSIIFISQKHYYNNSSYDCFLEGLNDVMDIIDYLEEKLRFRFLPDNIPSFTIRSSHFANLRDEIANKCKEDKKRFEVYINKDRRAWVDFSEPIGLEFGNKDYAIEDSEKYKLFVGDIIQNNTPKPSEMNNEIQSIKVLNKEIIGLLKESFQRQVDQSQVIEAMDKKQMKLTRFVIDRSK